MIKNIFKEKVLRGESVVGIFASLGSELAAEVLGSAKIDYTLIDMEHAPNDIKNVVNQMHAIKSAGGQYLVRIPVLDHIYA